MTREEKKQAKLKLKHDIADAKLNAKEMAEKVKTLTPDKVTLKNYQDWLCIKNGTYKSSEYKADKASSFFYSLILFFITFVCVAFTYGIWTFLQPKPILLSCFATSILPVANLAGFGVLGFEIFKKAERMKEIKADKTFAIYHELKKQKLLGKLDEVFNEYAKSDKCKQDYAAREEENLIASVESQKDWVGEQIGIAEQQTRILPKLLKLLQENDAHSRYEIEQDKDHKTATIRPAERGYALSEVVGKTNELIEDGVDIKFED